MIVSPGSRSTPLVIGLQWVLDQQTPPDGNDDGLEAHLVLDERSAAFQAVGIARATGLPAVLICTSGTAAVEYHPAVVEAHLAALPMLICTADRPPELQGTGAPQTIDQRKLYGTSVRAYLEPGPPAESARSEWRPVADDAIDSSIGRGVSGRPGPVHLNLAFREPLVGTVGQLPPPVDLGAADNAASSAPPHELVDQLVARCSGRRVAVVAGERAMSTAAGRGGATLAAQPSGPGELSPGRVNSDFGQRSPEVGGPTNVSVGPEAVGFLDAAHSLGWPVLADPLSGLRLDHPAVVPNFDPLLRPNVVAESLRPEVVIRLGALVSSKVTNQWLSEVPEQIAIDPAGWFPDPDCVVTLPIHANPAPIVEALDDAVSDRRLDPAPQGWGDRWKRVSDAVGEALEKERSDVGESAALAAVLDGMPEGGHLVVSSSMPVRDLEWFGPVVRNGVTVHSNRGANGIDGVIATAVGVALTGAPTAVVVGDLAMLHDVGSLVSAAATPNLAIVVIDNGGGGIFSFLSQHELLKSDQFERWWGTPSGADVASLAAGFGLDVADVAPADLGGAARSALATTPERRTPLFRVVSDRSANLTQHRDLLGRLAEAAEAALDVPPASNA